jgi:hypothetical protein
VLFNPLRYLDVEHMVHRPKGGTPTILRTTILRTTNLRTTNLRTTNLRRRPFSERPFSESDHSPNDQSPKTTNPQLQWAQFSHWIRTEKNVFFKHFFNDNTHCFCVKNIAKLTAGQQTLDNILFQNFYTFSRIFSLCCT